MVNKIKNSYSKFIKKDEYIETLSRSEYLISSLSLITLFSLIYSFIATVWLIILVIGYLVVIVFHTSLILKFSFKFLMIILPISVIILIIIYGYNSRFRFKDIGLPSIFWIIYTLLLLNIFSIFPLAFISLGKSIDWINYYIKFSIYIGFLVSLVLTLILYFKGSKVR